MYKNKEELYDKVLFYLNNPDKRFEISRNAKIRSLNEHTYRHRLSNLLKICDLI
jgi:spore maturation protein CgeB